VSSTMNMTGFANSEMGLSLTIESFNVLLDIAPAQGL
jgi:hypothetical protein